MPRPNAKAPVKMSLLDLLEKGPECYSRLVKRLRRPDKTVYVTLKALAALKLVARDDKGKRYVLTDAGRRELRRMRLVRAVEGEDDPEVIDRLADLHRALAARKADGAKPPPSGVRSGVTESGSIR
ncbi:MAG: hypothetical protein JRN45_00305 [Nitrososphaerota archaeon]|nr:hypothetical protein [Nitrososphaerota archaeon]